MASEAGNASVVASSVVTEVSDDGPHSSLEDYYTGVGGDAKVLFEFILHGVFLNLIGVVGFVGNGLCIAILSRPQMRSSLNLILCALASFDIVVIATSMLMLSLPAVYRYSRDSLFTFYYHDVYPYIIPTVYALALIAQTGSVYSTLCVTVERSADIITYGRTKVAVLGVFLFSITYNASRFFEITWRHVEDSSSNSTKPDIITTEMRQDPTYISVYITWMYLVFMYAVPFGGLSVLNMLMFLDVRRSNNQLMTLSTQEKKELKLAVMLMIVVLVFLICNALAFIVNIMELFGISYKPLTEVSNLLVTVNSSCNIFIYTIFGEKFQRQLCKYLRQCCCFSRCFPGADSLFLRRDDTLWNKSVYSQQNANLTMDASPSGGVGGRRNASLVRKESAFAPSPAHHNSSQPVCADSTGRRATIEMNLITKSLEASNHRRTTVTAPLMAHTEDHDREALEENESVMC